MNKGTAILLLFHLCGCINTPPPATEWSDHNVESMSHALYAWVHNKSAFPGLEATADADIEVLRGSRALGTPIAVIVYSTTYRGELIPDISNATWHFLQYNEQDDTIERLDKDEADAFEANNIKELMSGFELCNKELVQLRNDSNKQEIYDKTISDFQRMDGFWGIRFDSTNLFWHEAQRNRLYRWGDRIEILPLSNQTYSVSITTSGLNYFRFTATLTPSGVVGHLPVQAGGAID